MGRSGEQELWLEGAFGPGQCVHLSQGLGWADHCPNGAGRAAGRGKPCVHRSLGTCLGDEGAGTRSILILEIWTRDAGSCQANWLWPLPG